MTSWRSLFSLYDNVKFGVGNNGELIVTVKKKIYIYKEYNEREAN